VINETAARTFWPGESPIGARIVLPGALPTTTSLYANRITTTLTVVGVAGDVRHVGLGVPPRPEVYLNSMQSTLNWEWLALVVRTDRDPAALGDSVKATVHEVNPNVPLERVSTLEATVSRSIAEPKIYTFFVGIFAALAVVLAAVGLYGLVSYTVSQRTHELGVRVALGATRAQIVQLVLGQGLWLSAIGAALGLAGAFATTRLFVGLVTGVRPNDPTTFGLVTVALLLSTLVASYLPARRAARVDPMTALRSE
jgi:putative ABC transport system permease protein